MFQMNIKWRKQHNSVLCSSQVTSFSTSLHDHSSQSFSCSLSSFSSSYSDSSIQKQTSETEGYYQRSQMCSLTKNCGPSVFQSRPALTSSEVSEMAVSFSHGDGRTITNQIPQMLPDGATFWSM